jgi:hypothetical protein
MIFLHRFLRIFSDKIYLQLMFFKHFHRFINFKNPKTFNEKLQWLKIYDRKSEYTTMVDKYLVKDYVASKIGKEYIIPTIGVWNHPNEIDFNKLPDQYVLKWNHDSGSVVICKNKKTFDRQAALEKLKDGDGKTGFWYGREWPYKNVSPKIIAEKYISNEKDDDNLTDYKIHCFDGEPKLILVCKNRFSKTGLLENFYDEKWNLLNLHRPNVKPIDGKIARPIKFDEMLGFARTLSEGIPFARVDFYESFGKIYFGEMTFYPASGFLPFVPREWDYKLGRMLNI